MSAHFDHFRAFFSVLQAYTCLSTIADRIGEHSCLGYEAVDLSNRRVQFSAASRLLAAHR